MSEIKVISSNTIIKKITVGTPVPQIAQIQVVTDVAELKNVTDPSDQQTNGQLLIFNTSTGNYETGLILNSQTIDGGDTF
jgi:hypothetical protein